MKPGHFLSELTVLVLCIAGFMGMVIHRAEASPLPWPETQSRLINRDFGLFVDKNNQISNLLNPFYLPSVMRNYPFLETGKIVFASNRDYGMEIYTMNYDGSDLFRLTDNSAVDNSPAWSPDGSKIAFTSSRSGAMDIYVMDADGSNQTQLTIIGDCGTPEWSPDGSLIAFDCYNNLEGSAIYTIHPDGSGLNRITDPAVMQAYYPEWSPDGTKIAFTGPTNPSGIYLMNADGSNPTLLLEEPWLGSFAWSPDGKRIALTKNSPPIDFSFDLFIYAIESGIMTRLTDTTYNHNGVNWSPSGAHLVFHSNPDVSDFEIITMDAYGGSITNITNNPAGDNNPDWTK